MGAAKKRGVARHRGRGRRRDADVGANGVSGEADGGDGLDRGVGRFRSRWCRSIDDALAQHTQRTHSLFSVLPMNDTPSLPHVPHPP